MHQIDVDFNIAASVLLGVVEEYGYNHIGRSSEDGACYLDPKGDYSFHMVTVCIVAKAFERLGITRALVQFDGMQFGPCYIDSSLWENAEKMGVTFNEDAKNLFRNVQSLQDDGFGWGLALADGIEQSRKDVLATLPQYSPASNNTLDAVARLKPAVKPEKPLAPWEQDLLNGVVDDEAPW